MNDRERCKFRVSSLGRQVSTKLESEENMNIKKERRCINQVIHLLPVRESQAPLASMRLTFSGN